MSRVTRSIWSTTAWVGAVEQQVRLVEQEHEFRLIEIANLRQFVEQLRQHPEQERRIEFRRVHQLLGGEHIDDAVAVGIGLDEVVDVERGLAEELVGALLLEHQQAALDDADGCRRDIAVLAPQFRGAAYPSRR